MNPNIIVTPFPVTINKGENKSFFRLAAPRDILLKSFYITWSKTGDSLPATYAPLRKTEIIMVKGTLKRSLKVEGYLNLKNNLFYFYFKVSLLFQKREPLILC